MNTNRTLQELNDAIKTEMQLDPGLISDVERKAFINDCISDIGSIGLFEKVDTLPVVDGVVDLPDDLITIIDVKYDNRYLIPIRRMITMSGDRPIGYTVMYNVMELFPPLSSGDIEVFYAYRPKNLNFDTDKPDIPNGFDKMIVDWAVAHAHRKNGNIGLYREYMGGYNEKKADLVNELTRRYNSRVTMQHNAEYMETPSTPFDFI
jgi:hypothetical protein